MRNRSHIGRLEDQMEALLVEWPMQPVVAALMALRGFARIGAMILVSELGGAWRFDHPRQLMAYLGLVPTENTSDLKKRRGKLRGARLQREHLAVDAGKRRVQAAVVGIKYGGGFGHDHRTASM